MGYLCLNSGYGRVAEMFSSLHSKSLRVSPNGPMCTRSRLIKKRTHWSSFLLGLIALIRLEIILHLRNCIQGNKNKHTILGLSNMNLQTLQIIIQKIFSKVFYEK